jgi:hypothetical protein
MEEMIDRKSLRFSAILLVVGVVMFILVTVLFHPGGIPNDDAGTFRAYANSTYWYLIHTIQFAGNVIIILGLLALFSALNVKSGLVGVLNRFAAYSAVASLAFFAAVYAVDGIALRETIDAWLNAPPPAQSAYFAVAEGIRVLEWGVRSFSDYLTGLSLVLFATVITLTARISRPVGYIMGLTGLGFIARGYTYGLTITTAVYSNPPSINEALTIFVIDLGLLVWTIWLLISAYRMKQPIARTP